MHTTLAAFLVIVSLYAGGVEAYPDGAPASTCDHLTPSSRRHRALPQNASTNPYYLDLSPFDNGSGSFSYTPGKTYTCEY